MLIREKKPSHIGFLSGRDIEGAKFIEIDLLNTGIENAKNLRFVDLSKSFNPPKNLLLKCSYNCLPRLQRITFDFLLGGYKPYLEAHDIRGLKLGKFDLDNIGASLIKDFRDVDFGESYNAPEDMLKNAYLTGATFGNFDLMKLSLEGQDNLDFVDLSSAYNLQLSMLKDINREKVILTNDQIADLQNEQKTLEDTKRRTVKREQLKKEQLKRYQSFGPYNFMTKSDKGQLEEESKTKMDFSYQDLEKELGHLNLDGADFSNYNFSYSYNHPLKIFKLKILKGANLSGLDLENSGLEIRYDSDLTNIDFSNSYHFPEDVFDKANLQGSIFRNTNLRKSAVEKALNLKYVDFKNAIGLPHNLGKLQDLTGSDLSGQSLKRLSLPNPNERTIQDYSSGESSDKKVKTAYYFYGKQVMIIDLIASLEESKGEGEDKAKRKFLGKEFSDHLFVYLGRGYSYQQFKKMSKIWDLMEKKFPLFKNILMKIFLEKIHDSDSQKDLRRPELVEDKYLEKILSLASDEIFINLLPESCKKYLKDFHLDLSWVSLLFPGKEPNTGRAHFYHRVKKVCDLRNDPENLFEVALQKKKILHEAYIKAKDGTHEGKSSKTEIKSEYNEASLLETYYKKTQQDSKKSAPITVTFKALPISVNEEGTERSNQEEKYQEGQDAGGLRREYFNRMGDYIHKMGWANEDGILFPEKYKDKVIGKMLARILFIEEAIFSFPINAPRSFYKDLLGKKDDFVEELTSLLFEGDDSNIRKFKLIKTYLSGPLDKYLNDMSIEESMLGENKSTYLARIREDALSSFGVSSGCLRKTSEKLIEGLHYYILNNELKSILESFGPDELKLAIEGKTEHTIDEFFDSFKLVLPNDADQKKYLEVFKKAIGEIFYEYKKEGSEGEKLIQTFIKKFYRSATGSETLGKEEISFHFYLDEGSLYTFRTCIGQTDCPKTRDKNTVKKTIKKSLEHALSDGFQFH